MAALPMAPRPGLASWKGEVIGTGAPRTKLGAVVVAVGRAQVGAELLGRRHQEHTAQQPPAMDTQDGAHRVEDRAARTKPAQRQRQVATPTASVRWKSRITFRRVCQA